MRPIDADKIVFDYSGLANISPYDFAGVAKYFADQIKAVPTVPPPPNDPLTLEELREMDGEPVWIQHLGENKDSRWRIIKYSTDAGLHVEDSYPALYYGWDTYGWLWNAYRRKPEEG